MTTLLSTLIIFIKTLVNHLWLSVSSVKFYQDVFSSYRGYGIRYILTLSTIGSLMCTIILLTYTNKIQKYLSDDIISESIKDIDNVMRKLPTIGYNGKDISLSEDSLFFIYDDDNVKVLAIDTNGKLSHNERVQIPILLLKDQININFSDAKGKAKNKLPIKYAQIFGSEAQVLTRETIKSNFVSIFKRVPEVLIYILFPVTALMIFINTLVEKSLMIVLVFIISHFARSKSSLKDSIRVVLFSSGFYAIFQFVASITLKELSYVLWIVQSWANILMIIGVMKSQDRLTFLSK